MTKVLLKRSIPRKKKTEKGFYVSSTGDRVCAPLTHLKHRNAANASIESVVEIKIIEKFSCHH